MNAADSAFFLRKKVRMKEFSGNEEFSDFKSLPIPISDVRLPSSKIRIFGR